MRHKLLSTAAVAAALVVSAAAPAAAHITTDPGAAPKGGEITLRFRVPNEAPSANVVKLDIAFPTDHPLLGVAVEPLPGWSSKVTEAKLDPPVQTDDGPVGVAVSEIVWTAAAGGGTEPSQFQEFPILVQALPTAVNQVVFKALQTFSDGSIVRWIDPVVAGAASPEHPTPILALTAAAAATGAAPQVSVAAGRSDAGTAETIAVVAAVIAALGLIVAVVALATRRGPRSEPS